MQSLQVVYRATVMIGALVVGALAYRAYGPELEKLQPVVARIQELVAEVWSPEPDTTKVHAPIESPHAPPGFNVPATPLAAVEPPPLIDANLQRAGTWDVDEPSSPIPPAKSASPVAAVVRALNELGVSEYALSEWGSSGHVYRFHCSAPWGPGGRYSQHFEAIAADPCDAARQVLEQVNEWHAAK